MLNFLNTTVLFAAAAALIPLLIHLFSKRKVKTVEFSSLRHLKAMQKRQVRRLKIKQLLLLLIRMLIILTVVLAFARPTTKDSQAGSHAAVSAAILFDNSASMNRFVTDGNLFDLAKMRTYDLLDIFGEADEICLIPLSSSTISGDIKLASSATSRKILDRIDHAGGKGDLNTALNRASLLLSNAKNLNREIYLVTDRQQTLLPDTVAALNYDGHLFALNLPMEEHDNCGVTSVDLGGQLIIPGHDFIISATIKNYTADNKNEMIASLFFNGNRVAQSDFSAKAGEETLITFERSVSRTGLHQGYIEISDDKFPSDNRYYFSFDIPERFNLLIIDGDQTGRLLQLALSPSENINSFWSVQTVQTDNLTGLNIWEYDAIILAGAPRLDETYIQRLESFVNRGRSLFITYGISTDVDFFNNNYSKLSGLTITRAAPPQVSREGFYSLAGADVNHPIFSIFDLKNHNLPEIKFYALPKTKVANEAQTIMSFTGNHPALVEYNYNNNRVITMTAMVAPTHSDLAASAFFVPLISRIAEYIAADLSEYDTKLFCGEPIYRSLDDNIPINQTVALLTPDSSRINLMPEDINGRLMLKIPPLHQPGFYPIVSRGETVDLMPVNLTITETDLEIFDWDRFEKSWQLEEINQLDNKIDLTQALASFRFGRELWPWFIWLAVMLIIAEIMLARGKTVEEE